MASTPTPAPLLYFNPASRLYITRKLGKWVVNGQVVNLPRDIPYISGQVSCYNFMGESFDDKWSMHYITAANAEIEGLEKFGTIAIFGLATGYDYEDNLCIRDGKPEFLIRRGSVSGFTISYASDEGIKKISCKDLNDVVREVLALDTKVGGEGIIYVAP